MMSSVAILCASLSLMVVPSNEGAAQKPAMHPIESKIVEKTNAERARYGLPPLAIDNSLLGSARQHAVWMTNNRTLQHTHAGVAENIAMGQGSSEEVMRDWMNSPGHRANILNPSYRRIGAAAFTTPSGTIYWCQQFLW
jgi:uncharacterized protein YkwD